MHTVRHMCFCNPFRCTITSVCSSNLIFAHYTRRKSINVLKRLNDLCDFFEIKMSPLGNMYVNRGIINLTCIVVAVDSRCVCGCVRLGVAGGPQYPMSREPPCGLVVLLGRPVPHQIRESVI